MHTHTHAHTHARTRARTHTHNTHTHNTHPGQGGRLEELIVLLARSGIQRENHVTRGDEQAVCSPFVVEGDRRLQRLVIHTELHLCVRVHACVCREKERGEHAGGTRTYILSTDTLYISKHAGMHMHIHTPTHPHILRPPWVQGMHCRICSHAHCTHAPAHTHTGARYLTVLRHTECLEANEGQQFRV